MLSRMFPCRTFKAWTSLSMYVSQLKHTSLHRDEVVWTEFLRSLNVQTLEASASISVHASIWEYYRWNHFNHHDVIPHNCYKTNFSSLTYLAIGNNYFKWLKPRILYRLLWNTQFLVKYFCFYEFVSSNGFCYSITSFGKSWRIKSTEKTKANNWQA